MRTCKTCGEEKEDFDFSSHVNKKTGVEYSERSCKECVNVKRKGHQTESHLKYNHGISQVQWDLILKSQDGECKICGEEFDGKICTDHDHKTHVVRGLLCHKCNTGIGLLRDNPELLIAAADYLKRKPNALKELCHGE